MPSPDAAERFLAAHGRVLDRRRFERLFRDGDPEPVARAVAAYRNADGGFGHALEPDGRSPGSQPAAVALALRTLDEADAWDDELVGGTLDWLERNAPDEGGAAFVDPSIAGWPHAPWWVPEDGARAALYSTGQITAVLYARGVDHPWLAGATEVMWSRIDALTDAQAYELIGAARFLDAVPSRERARAALEHLAPALHAQVTLDPDAPGEVHGILDFAPEPQSLARALFDDATVQRHLDHLAAGQREDGGWTFNWPAWSPAAEADWRGSLTVDALLMLRANRR
jgi:hypothetical protein